MQDYGEDDAEAAIRGAMEGSGAGIDKYALRNGDRAAQLRDKTARTALEAMRFPCDPDFPESL